MSISPTGTTSPFMVARLAEMRQQMTELEEQLGTGRRASTYGGLGRERNLDIAFRQRLGQIQSFQQTIGLVGLRMNVLNDVFSGLTDLRQEAKNVIDINNFLIQADGHTQAQTSASITLRETIGLLNSEVAGRYMLSGRTVETRPVVEFDTLFKGTGTMAGLTQVIDERRQADLGATGLGRLDLSIAGTTVTLAEDAVSPFGFKIDGVVSTLSNVTITGPAGAPATFDADFTGQPVSGETIRVHLSMPDGSTTDIELKADPAGINPNTFAIGATPADTAANFQAALDTALQEAADTKLRSASAMAAGNDFFDTYQGNPSQRVDGPPFDTATALRDGSADTVAWYVGDNSADSPRTGVAARIDTGTTVGYGVRANEEGMRFMVQTLAVFTAETFTPGDTTDKSRYQELADRARAALDVPDNVQSVEQIHIEIASIHKTVDNARQRHISTAGSLTSMIEEIEGVDLQEVAAKMLTLQTRMQATYEATSMLLNLSLVNYL